MDGITQRAREFLAKYKYVALVLLIGLGLMLLPEGKEETAEPEETTQEVWDLEQELEQILAKIEGVGEVRVLLTVAEGERVLYQTDTDANGSDTVIITDSDKNQQGLVAQSFPQTWLGAIVVCKGGGSASVRLAVVEAVSRATGLGADQICVLKMK